MSIYIVCEIEIDGGACCTSQGSYNFEVRSITCFDKKKLLRQIITKKFIKFACHKFKRDFVLPREAINEIIDIGALRKNDPKDRCSCGQILTITEGQLNESSYRPVNDDNFILTGYLMDKFPQIRDSIIEETSESDSD